MHIQPNSMGIEVALFLWTLCFPLDLWSLCFVGRSLCDYRLHTDLYLTFNYLRGSAAFRCQYIPSFETVWGTEAPLVFTHNIPFLSTEQDSLADPVHSGSSQFTPRAKQRDVLDIHTRYGIWKEAFGTYSVHYNSNSWMIISNHL